jgi:hypothetical protein
MAPFLNAHQSKILKRFSVRTIEKKDMFWLLKRLLGIFASITDPPTAFEGPSAGASASAKPKTLRV